MNKTIILILPIIAALTLNCGFESHDHVLLIRTKDPVILSAIERAREEWETCHKENIFLTADDTYPDAIPLDILPPGEKIEYEGGERSGLTYFDAFEKPTRIHIETMEDTDYYQPVIAHEMGHVLTGPLHHGTGLMSGGVIPTPDVYVTPYECSFFKD